MNWLKQLFKRTDIENQAYHPPLVVTPSDPDDTVSLSSATDLFSDQWQDRTEELCR